MGAILLAASRHSKSSRDTPRLGHAPRNLHGAMRLAAPTAALKSWLEFLADTGNAGAELTFYSIHPGTDMPSRSAMLHPVAASGGVLALRHGVEWVPAALPLRGCSIHVDRRTSCWSSTRLFFWFFRLLCG